MGFFAWLIVDTAGKRIRLRSLIGTFTFLLICFLSSANPSRIKWRPVVGGIVLQFIVGLLVLRWSAGNEVIKFISHNVSLSALDMSYTLPSRLLFSSITHQSVWTESMALLVECLPFVVWGLLSFLR